MLSRKTLKKLGSLKLVHWGGPPLHKEWYNSLKIMCEQRVKPLNEEDLVPVWLSSIEEALSACKSKEAQAFVWTSFVEAQSFSRPRLCIAAYKWLMLNNTAAPINHPLLVPTPDKFEMQSLFRSAALLPTLRAQEHIEKFLMQRIEMFMKLSSEYKTPAQRLFSYSYIARESVLTDKNRTLWGHIIIPSLQNLTSLSPSVYNIPFLPYSVGDDILENWLLKVDTEEKKLWLHANHISDSDFKTFRHPAVFQKRLDLCNSYKTPKNKAFMFWDLLTRGPLDKYQLKRVVNYVAPNDLHIVESMTDFEQHLVHAWLYPQWNSETISSFAKIDSTIFE